MTINRIIAAIVAVSILIATFGMARPHESHTLCMCSQSIVRVMTTSTATAAVHNHAPNNHNLQELALSLEKTHDFANSADYMDGLTACSKRSIYVGEADGSASSRLRL